MSSVEITPVILTYDEAPNIGRCLERLAWARRVVVLDSGSTDGTAEIVRRFHNVYLATRPFDNHTSQWNHAVSLAETPWVLALDADYLVPAGLAQEAARAADAPDLDAAYASFRYCVFGRPLRASLYPPRAVLFRRDRCRYEPDGHTQRLAIPGRTVSLLSPIDHDDHKPLSRWLASQDNYALLEVEKLLATPADRLSLQDRLRKTIIFAPGLVFLYTLLAKRTLLDGWPGWYYAAQRGVAETILSLRLLERRLR